MYEKQYLLVLAMLTAVLSLVFPVAGHSENVLEEILVTAQKRQQSIQDVPISINAFSADSLEKKGLTNISQVAAFAPNVEIDNTSPFGGSSQILSASIRGIGQNDFAANFEPGVGVYIDGVYFARSVGAVADLLDLERVEILKGPQGTLFGRNTIGGAISIVTRDPGETLTYKTEFTTGSYNRSDIRAAIDLPLIDESLYSSLSLSYKRRDGYQDIVEFIDPTLGTNYVADQGSFPQALGPAEGNGLGERGGEDVFNLRAKLKWFVADNITARFAVDYTHEDADAAPSTLLATNVAADLNDLAAGNGFDPVSGNPTFGSMHNACINTPDFVLNSLPAAFAALSAVTGVCSPRASVGTTLAGANTGGPGAGPRLTYGDALLSSDIDTTYANGANFSQLDAYGVSSTIDWSIDDSISLKSVTAYRRNDWAGGSDFDGSPISMAEATTRIDQRQFSQELQLNGLSFGQKLDWVVGLYYFTESIDENGFFTAGDGILQVEGPNEVDNDAYAAFTHLNYSVNDALSFTGGIRYSYEQKEMVAGQFDHNAVAVKLGVPAFLHPDPSDVRRWFPQVPLEQTFSNVSLKVGAEYRFNEQMMGYVSYSEGFKSGGWTNRLTLPVPCSNPGPGVAFEDCLSFADGITIPGVVSLLGTDELEFDEETAISYEAGIKSQLFENRLQLNVSAFFVEYEDLQIVVQQGVSPVTTNAGDAEVKGVEIDFQGIVTEGLTLEGGLGYMDAGYTRLAPPDLRFVNTVPIDGLLINTPEWSFNLAAEYVIALQAGGEIAFHADYSHKDTIANDAPNTPELIQGATDVVNLSVGYTSASGVWSLSLGGNNITDERYLYSGFNQPGVGVIDGVYSRPAEWFLTLRVNRP